ncbi:MAG: S26 family signal peptidase [Bacilli bacterium]
MKKLILFICLLFGLIALGSKFFFFNLTESLPKGIYLIVPGKDIKKGDIVAFNIPGKLKDCKYIPITANMLLKEVGALENDKVSIINESLYINEKKYGKIYKSDSLGNVFPKLLESDLQPLKGYFLPLATVSNSYDGRYYGTIKIDTIKHKAKLFIKF